MSTTDRSCQIALARAFDVLGKRWTGVVLGVLLHGPVGFSALSRAVGGISESVLSDRLAELARVGLVRRTVEEGPPVAVSYALTPAGEALVPAFEALEAWAEEHLTAESCAAARASRGAAAATR